MNVLLDITNHTVFIELVRSCDPSALFSVLHLWSVMIIINLQHAQTLKHLGCIYWAVKGCLITNVGPIYQHRTTQQMLFMNTRNEDWKAQNSFVS